jgi:predicted DNA-binding protein with PD1-like motif
MRAKLLQASMPRTFVIAFDKGDEVVAGLMEFARRHDLGGSRFTAIGAFQDVMLGYFQADRKDYKRIPIREQVEVLSLIGDIALQDRSPKLHAHVVVGKADGSAHGGHLLEAHVWPTLEVVLEESPKHMSRRPDPETGLALLSIDDAEAA